MSRAALVLVLSGLLLGVAALGSLTLGAVPISFSDVFLFLSGIQTDALTDTEKTIVLDLRLPRVVSACLVGASLGAAGVGLQGVFRNPLADPFVIGASSGAGFGVTLLVISGVQFSFLGVSGMSAAALAGSILAVLVVYGVASVGGQVSPLSLLLAGVALSSMINAFVSILMFLNDEKIVVIFGWLMGSLSGVSWAEVAATAISTVIGCTAIWAMSRPLDALAFGEDAAQSLGLPTLRYRFFLVAAASVATAAAVAAAGIIGFVGLISPHIGRGLVGARHVWLTPVSALIGSLILLLADGVARTAAAPAELPVGVLTALLGCPFFLFVLRTRRVLSS